MGHELVGQVIELGDIAGKRYGVRPGDTITVEPVVPCGHCEWCHTKHYYHKCRSLMGYGGRMTADVPAFLFGGYAEFMYIVPGSRLHKVKDGVPNLAASLSSVMGSVMGNGVRWVKTLGRMTFGQSLVISGVGSQGLATLIAAREYGVGPIAISGLSRDQARFDLAREFGVDFTMNIEQEDPLKAVPDLFGGPRM